MVSQKERDCLIAAWGKEPLYVAGTVVRCVACLLVLCGLAFIGVASEPLAERTAQWAPSHPAKPAVAGPVAFETACRGACYD